MRENVYLLYVHSISIRKLGNSTKVENLSILFVFV
jgi:hypothetical protein